MGNSFFPVLSVRPLPVHPHACGELRLMAKQTGSKVGSSPRLWGTLWIKIDSQNNHRFIPTPVGNSFSWALTLTLLPVHPHACGELIGRVIITCKRYGSSPRLWGTRVKAHEKDINCRFIPTPVGNSTNSGPAGQAFSVHPHACGELPFFILEKPTYIGSSPRLWGTLVLTFADQILIRFIPTPVGNSSSRIISMPTTTVHPHACGELLVGSY